MIMAKLRIELEIDEANVVTELSKLVQDIANAKLYGWRYPNPVVNDKGEAIGTISVRHV